MRETVRECLQILQRLAQLRGPLFDPGFQVFLRRVQLHFGILALGNIHRHPEQLEAAFVHLHGDAVAHPHDPAVGRHRPIFQHGIFPIGNRVRQ